MADEVQLTIQGDPNEEVTVAYRGDRESDEPAPVVYEGHLGADGRLSLSVPRAYLVIHSQHGTTPLPLHQETESDARTVQLPTGETDLEDKVQRLINAAKQWQRGDKQALDSVKGKPLFRRQWAEWIGRVKNESSEQELREAAILALETEPDLEER